LLPGPFNQRIEQKFLIGFGYWVWDGTKILQMHPVQYWNREVILKRIGAVEILTLMAHDNHDKMGRSFLRWSWDLITSADIEQRYGGQWTYWNPVTRSQEIRQGLHHLRVVLLMGCKTGGKSTGDEDEIEAIPDPGSLAHTFYKLCARIVIYTTQNVLSSTINDFVELFYRYATIKGKPIVEAAKETRDELMRRNTRTITDAAGIRLIKKPGAEYLYLAP